MSCPICKQRQVAMLENMIAIDAILFPGTTPKTKLSESEYKHYSKVKNATLLNLYEIYKVMDYISENTYDGDVKLMETYSFNLGKMCLEDTVKLFQTNETLLESLNEQLVSENVNDNNIVEVSSKLVLENILITALDRLMLESAIENGNIHALDNSQGELLLNAHKSFRNDLISFVI